MKIKTHTGIELMKESEVLHIRKRMIKRFEALDTTDTEVSHGKADEILLDTLRELGFGDIARSWKYVERCCGGFWYA